MTFSSKVSFCKKLQVSIKKIAKNKRKKEKNKGKAEIKGKIIKKVKEKRLQKKIEFKKIEIKSYLIFIECKISSILTCFRNLLLFSL